MNLLILTLNVLAIFIPDAADAITSGITVDHHQYKGFLNVWHSAAISWQQLSTVPAGFDEDEDSLRKKCANFCSLKTDCDAFYSEHDDTSGQGNCVLVDEGGLFRMVGQGVSNKTYFVKENMTSSAYIPLIHDLVTPCDFDTGSLTPAECDSILLPQAVVFYTATSNDTNYLDVADLITDQRCESRGEDRIALCELQGETVNADAGPLPLMPTIFKDAFLKASSALKGLSTISTAFSYVKMTFVNAPRKVTRLILRSANAQTDTRLKKFTINIYSADPSAAPTPYVVEFANELQVAVMVTFDYAGGEMHKQAHQLELTNLEWWSAPATYPKAFKLDLFLAEPESMA